MHGGLFTLILAAGSAERYGSNKPLATFHGETLLRHALARASTCSGEQVLLVLGAHWRELVAGCLNPPPFLLNSSHKQGLASSLTAGVAALSEIADAIMVLLVDQPLISDEHILNLVQHWRQAPTKITGTSHSGLCGVPAIFPRAFFDELRQLRGDQGARKLIAAHGDEVIALEFADAALDIDTPADLERALRHRPPTLP